MYASLMATAKRSTAAMSQQQRRGPCMHALALAACRGKRGDEPPPVVLGGGCQRILGPGRAW